MLPAGDEGGRGAGSRRGPYGDDAEPLTLFDLLREWCSVGYDPDAFWRQTPASFSWAMRGAVDRMRRAGERDVALAHTTATMTRAKKVETLDRYLPRRRDRRGRGGSMLGRLQAIADATKDLS